MKIFVTGVTGFLGYVLASDLALAGHDVAGLLRRDSRRETQILDELPISFYFGDMNDRCALGSALASFRPDVICHLAAKTRVAESFQRPLEYIHVNFDGTVNIAEVARQECPELKKFIFAGSVEEYGNQPESKYPLVEECELMPDAPYAVAKVAAEKYLGFLSRSYSFPAVLFRQTNCYGRTRDTFFVTEAIAYQMLNSNSIRLGDPTPVRDFLYVNDLIGAYVKVIERAEDRTLNGQVFNISTGIETSISKLAELTSSKIGWHGKIVWNTKPIRPGEVKKIVCDSSKFRRTLGWKPEHDLSSGLDLVIAGLRKKLPNA